MSQRNQAVPEVVVRFDVDVPSRDGVILKCNMARPAGDRRWPVIVIRTPYGKDGPKPDPLLDLVGIAREGFVVVLQDVRQRGRSGGEGDFVPFVHEGADGEDLIDWAAALPFSTGDVFGSGGSYGGFAQWAAAVRSPSALRAIAPSQSPSTPWRSFFYKGGVPEIGGMAAWFMSLGVDTLMRRHAHDPMALGAALTQLVGDINALPEGGVSSLPLESFEPLARNGLGDHLFEILTGDDANSPILRAMIDAQAYEHVTVPALISGGWYDYFCQGSIDQFVGMRSRAGSTDARQRSHLIMGPWTHASQSSINGERNFGIAGAPGTASRGGLRTETLRFFREQLVDTDSQTAPVKIFVMGANVWRDEWEWPIARTQMTPWYLGSNGDANSLNGNGVLDPEPRPSPADRFVYDPANPVPTWGGGNLGALELAGARDQRRVESRNDVLVYTSDILQADVEVTGTAVVELWAASSAPDTDFVARLVDVEPDGTAYNVAEGILRARYRHNPEALGAGVPLEPREPYLFRIELTPTSNLFKTGHRIRLDITSSSFPRWARNLNVWEQRGATLAEAQVAHQLVLHDDTHPSRVILPVIPHR